MNCELCIFLSRKNPLSHIQDNIKLINELAKEASKDPWDWAPPEVDKKLIDKIEKIAIKDLNI